MNTAEKEKKLKELEERRISLPSGSIAKKSINGKTYYYHRTSVEGKRKEEYIPSKEAESLKARILEGRSIDKEISELEKEIDREKDEEFLTDVKTGEALEHFASSTSKLRRRHGITEIMEYLNGDVWGKVFVLYGLRRGEDDSDEPGSISPGRGRKKALRIHQGKRKNDTRSAQQGPQET